MIAAISQLIRRSVGLAVEQLLAKLGAQQLKPKLPIYQIKDINILDFVRVPPKDNRAWVVVPTTKAKEAVGQVANQLRNADLPVVTPTGQVQTFGKALVEHYTENQAAQPVHILRESQLILLPTRESAESKSSAKIIQESVQQLIEQLAKEPIKKDDIVVMPLLGSGSGRMPRQQALSTLTDTLASALEKLDPEKRPTILIDYVERPPTAEAAVEAARTAGIAAQEAKEALIAAAPKPTPIQVPTPDEYTAITRKFHELQNILRRSGLKYRVQTIHGFPKIFVSATPRKIKELQELVKASRGFIEESPRANEWIITFPAIKAQREKAFIQALTKATQKYADVAAAEQLAKPTRRAAHIAALELAKIQQLLPEQELDFRLTYQAAYKLAEYLGPKVAKPPETSAFIRQLSTASQNKLTLGRSATIQELVQDTDAVLVPYLTMLRTRRSLEGGEKWEQALKALNAILSRQNKALIPDLENPGNYKIISALGIQEAEDVAKTILADAQRKGINFADVSVDEIVKVYAPNTTQEALAEDLLDTLTRAAIYKLANLQRRRSHVSAIVKFGITDGPQYAVSVTLRRLPIGLKETKDYDTAYSILKQHLREVLGADKEIGPFRTTPAPLASIITKASIVPTTSLNEPVRYSMIRTIGDLYRSLSGLSKTGHDLLADNGRYEKLAQTLLYDALDAVPELAKYYEKNPLIHALAQALPRANLLREALTDPQVLERQPDLKALVEQLTTAAGRKKPLFANLKELVDSLDNFENTIRMSVHAILDHAKNNPTHIQLVPNEFIAKSKGTAVKQAVERLARRAALRAALDMIEKHVFGYKPRLTERIVRGVQLALQEMQMEAGARVIGLRLQYGKELEAAAQTPVSEFLGALALRFNEEPGRWIWETAKPDPILYELARIVRGEETRRAGLRLLQLTLDPVLYKGGFAKALSGAIKNWTEIAVNRKAVDSAELRGRLLDLLHPKLIPEPTSILQNEKTLQSIFRMVHDNIESSVTNRLITEKKYTAQLAKEYARNDTLVTLGRVAKSLFDLAEDTNLLEKQRNYAHKLAESLHSVLVQKVTGLEDIKPSAKPAAVIRKITQTAENQLRALRESLKAAQAADNVANKLETNPEQVTKDLDELRKTAQQMQEGMTLGATLIPLPNRIFKPSPDTVQSFNDLVHGGVPRFSPILDWIQPTLFVYAKDKRLLNLYDLRRQIDISKAKFLHDWQLKWNQLWSDINPISKQRIIDAIEGKLDYNLLSPEEKAKFGQYRLFTKELAEVTEDIRGIPVKHKVGSEVEVKIGGKTVKGIIIGEDMTKLTYTIRVQDPKNPSQFSEHTVKISDVDPKFLPNYFPHRFRGYWILFYPHAAQQHKRMRFFDSIQDAINHLLNNTEWDEQGRPFVQFLQEKVQAGQATDIFDAAIKVGVDLYPRYLLPDTPFEAGLTVKQAGKIASIIKNELVSRGLTEQSPKGLTKQIFEAIRTASREEGGVHIRPRFAPLRRVSATLERLSDLDTYVQDPDLGFRIHIYQLASQMYTNKWRREADNILSELRAEVTRSGDQLARKLYNFAEKWARDLDDYDPGTTELFLQSLFERLKLGDYRSFIHSAAAWMSAIRLGNLVSPLVNLTQTIITTYPTLGSKYTLKGIETYLKYLSTRDQALQKILEETGAGIYAPVYTITANLPTRLARGEAADVVRGLLLSAFSGTEAFNRGVAALGAYYKALDAKMDPQSAIRFARAVVDRTQGDYSRTGVAYVMRGTLPSFLLQFRKFFSLYIGFVTSLFKELPTEAGRLDPKHIEIARFLFASTLIGGLFSFPFVEQINNKIYQETGVAPLDVIRQKNPMLYDLLTMGLPARLGIDMSKRVGIALDIDMMWDRMESGTPAEFAAQLSPWAGLLQDVLAAGLDIAKYQDDQSIDRFLQAVMPAALWYAYWARKQQTTQTPLGQPSGYITKPGIYSPRTGRLIMEVPQTDTGFWLLKMLGFRTTKESIHQQMVSRLIDILRQRRTVASQYERLVRSAIITGNHEAVQRILEEARNRGIVIDTKRIMELQDRQFLDALNRYYRQLPRDVRERALRETQAIEEWEPLPTKRPPRMIPSLRF